MGFSSGPELINGEGKEIIKMVWKHWTKEEKSILEANYEEQTPLEISKLLPNRTIHAIRERLIKKKMQPEKRTCRYCGKQFKPKLRSQIYCKQECNILRQKEIPRE